jgi:hypothetical protein
MLARRRISVNILRSRDIPPQHLESADHQGPCCASAILAAAWLMNGGSAPRLRARIELPALHAIMRRHYSGRIAAIQPRVGQKNPD